MDGIPDDLRQKLRNSMIGEKDRNQSNSENDKLFYIKIPVNSKDNESENGLKVYSKSSAMNDCLERQRLRNRILQLEKERLMEMQKSSTTEEKKQTQRQHDIMHRYNEVKDMAHEFIGTLNRMRGTSSKQLYEQFGLE